MKPSESTKQPEKQLQALKIDQLLENCFSSSGRHPFGDNGFLCFKNFSAARNWLK